MLRQALLPAGYLDAPAAALAPLSPSAKPEACLPIVTIVFCSLDGLKIMKVGRWPPELAYQCMMVGISHVSPCGPPSPWNNMCNPQPLHLAGIFVPGCVHYDVFAAVYSPLPAHCPASQGMLHTLPAGYSLFGCRPWMALLCLASWCCIGTPCDACCVRPGAMSARRVREHSCWSLSGL